MDDCIVDDVPDHIFNRVMNEPDDIRFELTMKDAISMYSKKDADASEAYSRPRLARAAAEYDKDGINLQPGWSLDLTMAEWTTGKAWDLSDPKVQSRVKLVNSIRPFFSIGSPLARHFPLFRVCRATRGTQG